MEDNKIKELLNFLNFTPKNDTNNIYIKKYTAHNNYEIQIDFNNKKINYGNEIVIGNATTSNFSKPENFVVLECVDRLLEKGYKPKNIELEKIYPSGHGHSGNLDILVYSEEHIPYLMVECKTAGTEYNKEHNKMLKDGGQLFTYYALDRATKYLCLYSSVFNNGRIEYKNSIVPASSEWKQLSSSQEIYLHWNKLFKDNGIFEEYASPYEIKHKALTYGMLKDLKEEDSGKIFNQIMEILRHNVVSDKPNAFNKLLNLFVCKIIDENKNETDELKFQWLDDDTDESLQMRLNDLYKDGMYRFLNINVTDYSEKQVDEALQGIQADESFKQTIKEMLINTRLKKSPNFAFKEVLDEKSFKANAIIVREIVELLQGYKFRYRQKHQFLGDFFELLLNTSMKQEAGQFFTPVPITRFIISSLPIKETINDKMKNSNNDNDILPTVIDYAIGSGHFLTEYMEQVQNIINTIDDSRAIPSIKNKIKTWRESEKFSWAKDYVYGIDLDDRLVKTAKVSAFFNGDGEANIIWANGLANFLSDEYIKKLKHVEPFNNKNNGQFDILISNPPYSVEAFKTTLKDGENTFELYNSLTDNSSEIECLFVERMKQLLKVGGWAGVILPTSILSNGGIYSRTREIIFKYFKIKAIVELGSGTFMKTGTNTIILFLERRADNEYKEIENSIDKFFTNKLDVTVAGIENAFSKYVSNVYDDLTFDNYIKIIEGNEVEHELYYDYKKEANGDIEYIRKLEHEKLLYFILTYNQETVIVRTGKKQEEKNFLGYEFSERRGHEGLKWLPNGTKLYNEKDLYDKTKANYYIYNAFNNKKVEIDESLSNNIFYKDMSNLFEYGTSKFDKKINLNKREKLIVNSKFDLVTIASISEKITKGTTPTTLGYSFLDKGIKFIKVENIDEDGEISNIHSYISEECNQKLKRSQLKKDDILFSIAGSFGRIAIIDKNILPANTNQALAIIRGISNNVDKKYLLYVLKYSNVIKVQIQKYAKGIAQYNISLNEVGQMKIPLAPSKIQKEIVIEIEKIEDKCRELRNIVENMENEKRNLISQCFNGNYILENLENITQIYNGGTPDTSNQDYWNGEINWATLVDTKNKYLYSTQRKITDEGLNYCNATILPVNSILFSSRATIGDVSIAKVPVATNQGYKNFVCKDDKVYYEYLYYILKHEAKNIAQLASGMTYPEISKTMISKFKIPLPTIDEQKTLVGKIEKYEKNISDAKNKIDDLEKNKKNILSKYL